MTPVPDQLAKFCLLDRWTAGAVVISSALFHGPALSQPSNRIGVSGYVAPRCWAAVPAAGNVRQRGGTWRIDGPAPARCSVGAMPLTISISKFPGTDVSGSSALNDQMARDDVAIIISPSI